MYRMFACLVSFIFLIFSSLIQAADVVPTDVQLPGTQPTEIGNLQTAGRCDNCHGGYDPAVEPAHNWRGSMMAHAGRDPIFWATVAVAEQDFDGAGDLCIRCHSGSGWLGGRSTPTDGSGLSDNNDTDGVDCDVCHRMTNPDQSEHLGTQNAPFLAHDGAGTGYYGSGEYVMWDGSDKLGPYSDAQARHQSMASRYHRSSDLCGTCHDVSNPVTGDLAPGNGAQSPLPAGTFSGLPGSPVEGKAAFNHPPYAYGVVERTYSEHKASLLSDTLVSNFNLLPAELQDGAIKDAYEAAQAAGRGGDYADGTPRYFTCQTCHMKPVTGQGCNKNPPVRTDLPLHDLTGGNTWMPAAIQYLDSQGKLLLGGGLTADEISGMNDGVTRARFNLTRAAGLSLNGNTVKVVNLTGHKLISGYPEGRRMWLNIQWYDAGDALLREDGAYGDMTVNIDGTATTVRSLLDLSGTNTRLYEAHGGISQAWANRLVNEFGAPADLPVAYDRSTGAMTYTLGQVATQASGTSHETFHFVLNDTLIKDNRIPPFGMSYNASVERNTLPVPASQYGSPGTGGYFNHWDELALNPPAGAAYANIRLMYQPTSWEYIQFLYLANNGSKAFLANEGANLLDAWLNTGMAEPEVMASVSWGNAPEPPLPAMHVDSLVTWAASKRGGLKAPATSFRAGDTVAILATVVDVDNAALSNATVTAEITNAAGTLVARPVAISDATGVAKLKWGKGTVSGEYTATVTAITLDGYAFDADTSTITTAFTIR